MFYRQSIALFGIVLPLIVAALVVGISFSYSNSMAADYAQKQKSFKAYDMNRIGGLGIEAQMSRKRKSVEQWKTQLSEETKSAMSAHLGKIQEMLPSKEFQRTVFEPLNNRSGFGGMSAQKSSQIHLGFRGTFRSVQRAFLELETRMPQLQLQELKMDPANSTTNTSQLNFDITYTAWEN